jgi:Flp pilus assembly protein TadD
LGAAKGQIRMYMGDEAGARSELEAAREFLERKIAERPDDARFYGTLGAVLAYLGEKDEAIAAARKGVELMPVSKEAKRGPARRLDLAVSYAVVGEHDLAIDELEYLLSIHGGYTKSLLRMDPQWDPLREHPRFKKLVGD